MDLLFEGVRQGKNVALTVFQGAERSRFLLKSELNLLAPGPTRLVKRVYHVVDSSRLVERVYAQAVQMPFRELGIYISKECEGFECGQASDKEYVLFVCSLKCILDKYSNNSTPSAEPCDDLVVFDGITLENLEGSCCEAIPADATGPKLPSVTFNRIRRRCFVFACNEPLNGLSAELGADFMSSFGDLKRDSWQRKTQLLLRDSTGKPFKFGGLNYQDDGDESNKRRLHEETSKVLLSLVADNNKIVVFFPSYGKMVEYHNAWKQLGTLDKLGMSYGRENRAGDQFKNSLLQFMNEEKFTFLCSIRYHKEEELAEFVMAQASAVMFVGLPYPFMNDIWEERIRYNDEHQEGSIRLSGQDLHKYRAIEFLNGIAKRCLNEYRHKNVHVVILDEALESLSDKLAVELGSVEVRN